MERKMREEVHTKCTIFQAEINTNIKSIEDTMTKLESNLKKLESVKTNNEASIFVCVKDGTIKMEQSDKLLQNLNAVSQRETLQFKQYRAIDECMKMFEKLGELHDETGKTSYQTPNKTQTVPPFSPKQNKFCSASLTGEYNVEVFSDTKRCDIRGCTFLDDRVLLINDYENGKWKLLNSSFRITDYCDLPSNPYGLCVTGNEEVAVALGTENKVQFVSVGKRLKLSRSFYTKGQCTELAYDNENIFISNNCSHEVHIYNKNGHCLRTITVDKSAMTGKLIPFTYIALSKDHSKLVYSNHNNGIIIVNVKDGHNDCICTDQLSAANGLCVLDNDNILVADSHSKAIFQITDDGHILGVVLQANTGIHGPQSVKCVDKTNSRLIVTSCGNDKIKVFKLMK